MLNNKNNAQYTYMILKCILTHRVVVCLWNYILYIILSCMCSLIGVIIVKKQTKWKNNTVIKYWCWNNIIVWHYSECFTFVKIEV